MTKFQPAEKNLPKAIIFFLGFTTLIPIVDAGAKLLILEGYNPSFVTWGRFFFSAAVIAPILLIRRFPGKISKKDKFFQIIRALFIVLATFLFFSSIKTTKLADAIGILFTYPLLITLFAPIFLGEKAGKRRWYAVLTGFIGALLIIRPLGVDFQIGHIFALGSSICFTFFSITTRKLSNNCRPLTTLGFQVLIGAILMSTTLPFSWQSPSVFAICGFLIIGVISLLAHMMLILAYNSAAAPVLAPYGYFEIIMASILGFIFFKEVPDNYTWCGIIIVMMSGIYTSIREKNIHKLNKNSLPKTF